MSSDYTPDTIIIPLTKDQFTVIDAIDADLAQLKWYAIFAPDYANGGKFLAARVFRVDGRRKIEYIHRVILSRILGRTLLRNEFTDHVDHDTLYNCRCNLRLASRSQNMMNRGKLRTNTSGFKGVFMDKSAKSGMQQLVLTVKTSILALSTALKKLTPPIVRQH